MKKILLVAVAMIVLLFTGCNYGGYDFVDTNYHFNRAIIALPNGEMVEGDILKWADCEDCEQLTVTIKGEDGQVTRYLCNSVNCVLVEDVFK